ncbi:MAG TPA: hypothetical protein VK921_01935 [Anditalea sp.]|nr:hypothetical protein [Anditalea sp.]
MLLNLSAHAQSIISGKVKVKNESLSSFEINILVKNPKSLSTISYGITDNNGIFSIQVQSDSDSLLIVFRSLTTQEQQFMIANITQNLLVELEEGIQEIPEFTLKSIKNPVTYKDDTLSYSVEDFTNQNDRVVADILKKLPGIEVLENGKIMYEGMGIQKFYIDGMDLLEGKYNLASKNLSADAVESIQILENHQPLRVLDSLVFSERASLNLKLKRKNVWVGTGTAGLGVSPFLYEWKVSPMTFRNDLQMLYNVQSNNSGKDIGKELNMLTMEDLQEKIGAQANFKPWFGLPMLWAPSIKQERFLFNQSQMVSANVLKRNQGGTDLRTNISYLHDSHRQKGGIATTYFLPYDTIKLIESHQNRFLTSELDAELSWIKNEKKSYLKNIFNLNLLNNKEVGISSLNEVSWDQNANLPLLSISNSFQTLKPVGRQLLNIKSDVGFRQTNQNFEVKPGSFEEQLTDDMPYERLNQEINYQSIFAHHSIGITKGLPKNWSYTGNIGILYESEMMQSSLETLIRDNGMVVPEPFLNDLTYLQVKSYFNSQLNLNQEDFNLQLKIPLSYLDINVNDGLLTQQSKVSRLIMEPQLFMKYFLTGKWNTILRLTRINDFKGINDIHYGFIVRNFRTFQQRSTSVPEVLSHRLNYGINYRDPINSIFSSLNYIYVDTRLNTIMVSDVAPSGEVYYQTLDMNNKGTSHLTNLRISKYLPFVKTNLTISTNYQQRINEQIINSVLTDVKYEFFGSGIEFQVNPAKTANFSYKANLNYINSHIGERNPGKIRQFNHVLTLDIFIKENQSATVKWEHYDNRLTENRDLTGFVDVIYQYKFNNSRWDLSLYGQNILNKSNFGTFTADSFFVREQSFLLRPRQVMLYLNFAF